MSVTLPEHSSILGLCCVGQAFFETLVSRTYAAAAAAAAVAASAAAAMGS